MTDKIQDNKKTPVILVVCGASIATSTIAAMKIEMESKKRGIPVTIKKGKASEAEALVRSTNADLIVSTVPCKEHDRVPLLSGAPLITGVGQEFLFKQIFETILPGRSS